ncbi:MAG: hypothetical protein O3A80_04630 [bacterium]|nr:hypothetical protein [bacterium]
MKTLLSLLIFALSFSAGTAHAYLSPGEVFPDLEAPAQEVDAAPQAPTQALPVLLEGPEVRQASAESTLSSDILYIVGGFVVAIGIFGLIVSRKKKLEPQM